MRRRQVADIALAYVHTLYETGGNPPGLTEDILMRL